MPGSSSPAILAQAPNPRRLVLGDDGSDVDSYACPYQAVLDGIRSRILRDHRLTSL